MIRIINLRQYTPNEDEVLFRVDRSSILGNPFMMGGSSRDEVCDRYAAWFPTVKDLPAFKAALEEIHKASLVGDVALGCWCYPKRCHAETIKEYLEKYG